MPDPSALEASRGTGGAQPFAAGANPRLERAWRAHLAAHEAWDEAQAITENIRRHAAAVEARSAERRRLADEAVRRGGRNPYGAGLVDAATAHAARARAAMARLREAERRRDELHAAAAARRSELLRELERASRGSGSREGHS